MLDFSWGILLGFLSKGEGRYSQQRPFVPQYWDIPNIVDKGKILPWEKLHLFFMSPEGFPVRHNKIEQ